MLVAKLMLLRMKYGISRAELGSVCGITPQRIYELEKANYAITPATAEKLCCGMDVVLSRRQGWVDALRVDLQKHRSTLLEYVEENRYEL